MDGASSRREVSCDCKAGASRMACGGKAKNYAKDTAVSRISLRAKLKERWGFPSKRSPVMALNDTTVGEVNALKAFDLLIECCKAILALSSAFIAVAFVYGTSDHGDFDWRIYLSAILCAISSLCVLFIMIAGINNAYTGRLDPQSPIFRITFFVSCLTFFSGILFLFLAVV
jgi:hypothetical protein